MTKVRTLERQPAARLDTPTDLSDATVKEISAALNALLADAFALYLKTKNFHWHISAPHFRDYHLLLDEQAEQIFATTDCWPSGCARSVVPRCARSAISLGISRSKPTLLTSSRPTTCCAS